jgi:hypothetical protein
MATKTETRAAKAAPSTLDITRPAPPGPSLGTHLPASYVRDIGRLMYFWGWPLVNMHNRHQMFSKVKDFAIGGALPVGPLNRVSMLTDYIAPEQRSVATPNQDVVYGAAFLSLDTEPVVVQVPDFGKRYWVFQFLDQRTDTLGGVGAMYGTKPGFYMVVGPQWKGAVPNGISGVLHSPTNIAFIGPRVVLDDTAEDRQTIRPLVNRVLSYPLSEFDGTIKTKDWASLPIMADPGGGGSAAGAETKWVRPENYLSDLRTVLNEVPPLPGEEALYAWFRVMLDTSAQDRAVAEGLKQAAVEADNELFKEIFSYRYAGVPVGNDWVAPMNGAEFGFDYFSRTAAARANILVNPRRESAYFSQEYDADKQRLNGANRYTITFPKGGLPPVKGFWSITMYNTEHFFVPNDIKRYSIGTKNKDLTFGPDGSLTIYVQHTRPDGDKAKNWLPAPKEDFEVFMRAYWAEAPILENKWSPPPVVRV